MPQALPFASKMPLFKLSHFNFCLLCASLVARSGSGRGKVGRRGGGQSGGTGEEGGTSDCEKGPFGQRNRPLSLVRGGANVSCEETSPHLTPGQIRSDLERPAILFQFPQRPDVLSMVCVPDYAIEVQLLFESFMKAFREARK